MRMKKVLLIVLSVILYVCAVLFCLSAKEAANLTYLLLSEPIDAARAEDIFTQEAALLDSIGFYSKKEGKVITTLTRANQSNLLFSMVKQIDPNALISQSKVMGVYGNGFDKIKAKNIKLQETDFKKADEETDKTPQ